MTQAVDPSWLGLASQPAHLDSASIIAAGSEALVMGDFAKVVEVVGGAQAPVAEEVTMLGVQGLFGLGRVDEAVGLVTKIHGTVPDKLIAVQAAALKAAGKQSDAESLCGTHLTAAKRVPTPSTIDILEAYTLQVLSPKAAEAYLDASYICFHPQNPRRVKELKQAVLKLANPPAARAAVRVVRTVVDPVAASPPVEEERREKKIVEEKVAEVKKVSSGGGGGTNTSGGMLKMVEKWVVGVLGEENARRAALIAILGVVLLVVKRLLTPKQPSIRL